VSLLERRAGTPFTSRLLGGNVTECDLVASTVVGERIEASCLTLLPTAS
jgi:hypothetical protein